MSLQLHHFPILSHDFSMLQIYFGDFPSASPISSAGKLFRKAPPLEPSKVSTLALIFMTSQENHGKSYDPTNDFTKPPRLSTNRCPKLIAAKFSPYHQQIRDYIMKLQDATTTKGVCGFSLPSCRWNN